MTERFKSTSFSGPLPTNTAISSKIRSITKDSQPVPTSSTKKGYRLELGVARISLPTTSSPSMTRRKEPPAVRSERRDFYIALFFVTLLVLWLIWAVAQGQTATSTVFTITWPPQPGTISFNWTDAPPGTPDGPTGDLNSGTATITVPTSGTYHMIISMTPQGLAPQFATVTFNADTDKASVDYSYKLAAPIFLQIT